MNLLEHLLRSPYLLLWQLLLTCRIYHIGLLGKVDYWLRKPGYSNILPMGQAISEGPTLKNFTFAEETQAGILERQFATVFFAPEKLNITYDCKNTLRLTTIGTSEFSIHNRF